METLLVFLIWGLVIWGIASLCSSSRPKQNKRKQRKQKRKQNRKRSKQQSWDQERELENEKAKAARAPVVVQLSSRKRKLQQSSVKRRELQNAWIWKEILDSPRSLRPFRYRWPK